MSATRQSHKLGASQPNTASALSCSAQSKPDARKSLPIARRMLASSSTTRILRPPAIDFLPKVMSINAATLTIALKGSPQFTFGQRFLPRGAIDVRQHQGDDATGASTSGCEHRGF